MKYNETVQRIIENLNAAVLLFNEQRKLQYINPAGEILLENSARHLLGQSMENLWPNSKDFTGTLLQSLENGHAYTEREVQLQLPQHKSVTVDLTVSPLWDTQQRCELLVELLPVDRHLRIARDEDLLDQYQATRTLIRGMAHEIKNPLGGLRGAAQLLDQELSDDELREYTQVIMNEADRLKNLLNRMLGPSTLPQKRPMNIHEALERVRTLVQAEVSPGISIVRDYDPSIPDLRADPDQLIQALLNIARNAMQSLGNTGTIVFTSRAQRNFTIGHKLHRLVVRVDITDDGPGIPDNMIKKIFYPMITGRPDGTGLGLPMAQSLISQHGGLIECSSRPGNTTFTVILPLES